MKKTSVSELARKNGIKISTASNRISRGWSVKDATTKKPYDWSIELLAKNHGIDGDTVRKRINKGMNKIDAFILKSDKGSGRRKATNQQIVECEKLGLTIARSATLLRISDTALSKRIKKLGIDWRGKGVFNKKKQEIGVSDMRIFEEFNSANNAVYPVCKTNKALKLL